ncbi:alpha/beta fold hydrolase [Sphaerotilus microaerophilus]|uniref:alpha/beta fold hydrolase n=1 Tax=Sphaerotilus microaerophilus TaxID=2914710 RepID=UPI003D166A5D
MDSSSPIPVGHFVDIGEIAGAPQRVHYHDQGKGEVVIFLHGAGGGASGYSNFKGNYPVFAEAGFRSIVPDLLGYGLSSKTETPTEYHLDFFVSGVKGLVDQLGLKNVTLLGNSLGGAVALGYAAASGRRQAPDPDGAGWRRGVRDLHGHARHRQHVRCLPVGQNRPRGHALGDGKAALGSLAADRRDHQRARADRRHPDRRLAPAPVRAQHDGRPAQAAVPSLRLLGRQRPVQPGRRCDEAGGQLPAGPHRAGQPLRPLGPGGASRHVQPRLHRLPQERLTPAWTLH